MSIQIIDKNKPWLRLLAEIERAGNSYTEVGYQNTDKKEKTRDGKPSKAKVVDVAIYNEFGTANIPSRSFMRTFFEEDKDKIKKMCGNLYLMVITGRITTKRALGLIGEYSKGGIQKKINTIFEPPLAPATIKAKKDSTKPLIDLGTMRESVTHTEVIK